MKKWLVMMSTAVGVLSAFIGCGDDESSPASSAGTSSTGGDAGSNSQAGGSGKSGAGSSNGGSSDAGSSSGDAGASSSNAGSSGAGAGGRGSAGATTGGDGGTAQAGTSHAGAGADGGGSANGGDSGCPVGCKAPEDGAACPGSQVYWTCFGTTGDPTPPQSVLREFDDNCTSQQTPRPTFCCPQGFHSGC